jgi:hypothetical protein
MGKNALATPLANAKGEHFNEFFNSTSRRFVWIQSPSPIAHDQHMGRSEARRRFSFFLLQGTGGTGAHHAEPTIESRAKDVKHLKSLRNLRHLRAEMAATAGAGQALP